MQANTGHFQNGDAASTLQTFLRRAAARCKVIRYSMSVVFSPEICLV